MFWGARWVQQAQGGNFQANASFKGFADQAAGGTWASSPGNSSGPPTSVANYTGVIVATQAVKNGNVITGNVAELAVLKVDNPGAYQPDPGHPGFGVVVALVH